MIAEEANREAVRPTAGALVQAATAEVPAPSVRAILSRSRPIVTVGALIVRSGASSTIAVAAGIAITKRTVRERAVNKK